MTPRFSSTDALDRATVAAEGCGNGSRGLSQGAQSTDFDDLLSRQLCHAVCLATGACLRVKPRAGSVSAWNALGMRSAPVPISSRKPLGVQAGVVTVTSRAALGMPTRTGSVPSGNALGMGDVEVAPLRHHVLHVGRVVADEKVRRLDAARVVTAVEHEQAIGDRTNMDDVRDAVRSLDAPVVGDAPVACIVQSSKPEQATAHRLGDGLLVEMRGDVCDRMPHVVPPVQVRPRASGSSRSREAHSHRQYTTGVC